MKFMPPTPLIALVSVKVMGGTAWQHIYMVQGSTACLTVLPHLIDLSDFIGPGSPVAFSGPGEMCVNLTIQMDMALENDEKFHILLTSRQSSVNVLLNTATVVITDIQGEALMCSEPK